MVKKTVARSLQWFVRDQITFNRETVSALEAVIEALNEHNRALVSLAAQANERTGRSRETRSNRRVDGRPERYPQPLGRPNCAPLGKRVAANEIQFLRSVADLQGAFQHRSTLMESNFREIAKAQHADYLGALDRDHGRYSEAALADFQKVRAEYGQMIHDELRIIRHASAGCGAGCRTRAHGASAARHSRQRHRLPPSITRRFAFRFRGPEEQVRQTEEFYRPFFADCRRRARYRLRPGRVPRV